jgi:sugar phosphate permease
VTSSTLGAIDTSFLGFYSLGLFISGSLGDHFNPKLLLIIAYIGVAGLTAAIAVCGL